jgi:uncharacterized membrane protein YdjX (TVP38/TMEM64 family)
MTGGDGAAGDPDAGRAADGEGGGWTPDRRTTALVGVAALAVVAATAAAAVAFESTLSPAALRRFFERAGPLAPVAFVAVQALQVVVAPIPGQVLAGVGGFLFGRWLGTAYSMAGVVIGSLVVFGLTRRYGRPLVARLLDDGLVARFERFGDENGVVTLFVFFLLPTFPDDALCAVAGLWDLRLRTFLVLLVVGRTPSFLAAAHAGTSLQSGALGQATLVLSALAVLALAVYLGRDRIEDSLSPADSTNPDSEG